MAGVSKYTPELIEQIVTTYKTGPTMRETAEKFHCSQSTVSRFVMQSGYDREHVGGTITKHLPVLPAIPAKDEEGKKKPFRIMSRTLKLHSDQTGNSYTVSTESEVVDIESDNALMQLPVKAIDAFIDELIQIKAMVGNPL